VREAQGYEQAPFIVFANSAYKEVLLNWLAAANRVGITRVIIVGYSRALVGYLRQLGFSAFFLPMKSGKKFLWQRLFVFHALADAGVYYIHCDADGLLLRNPMEYIFSHKEADLVFSQGTVHPEELAKSRGFVVCMGFFFCRGGPQTSEVFQRAISIISEKHTDQASVNHVLEESVSSWTIAKDTSRTLNHRGTDFIVSNEPIFSGPESVTNVVILPHQLFQRYSLGTTPDTLVVHPLANQKAETKIAALAKHGLVFLRPDWRRVKFRRETLELITQGS